MSHAGSFEHPSSPTTAVAPSKEEAPFKARLFANMPSWLVSNVIHVVLLLLLALIPLHQDKRGTSQLIFMDSGSPEATDADDELLATFDFEAESPSEEKVPEIEQIDEPQVVQEIVATMAVKEDIPLIPRMPTALLPAASEGIRQQADIAASAINMVSFNPREMDKQASEYVKATLLDGLKGRTGDRKGDLLKRFGGNEETEEAVRLGLEWLKNQQAYDGSWSHHGSVNQVSATSMALLAFLGAGHTHLEGQYTETVEKGMKWLMAQQNKEGCFARETYSQAQATIALCELYGMTQDGRLREAGQLAVDFDEDFQNADGGWRYFGTTSSDMSVTGWYVMALISARMAGLYVDQAKLNRVHKFLDSVQCNDMRTPVPARRYGKESSNYPGSTYSYLPQGGRGSGSVPMTAEALLCRMYLGWEPGDHRVLNGCEFIGASPINRNAPSPSYYSMYYTTTTLHHVGGLHWSKWNNTMRVELPAMQIKTGPDIGSWPATGDAVGNGPVYSTCMALYCLESYYRHLPLFEMANK
jgi:hypothetical protein